MHLLCINVRGFQLDNTGPKSKLEGKLRIGQKMSAMNANQTGWFGCRVVFLLEPVIEKEFGIRSLQYIIIWLQLQLCLKKSNSCKFNVAKGAKDDQGSSCVQSYHVILGDLIDLGPSTLQNWDTLEYTII